MYSFDVALQSLHIAEIVNIGLMISVCRGRRLVHGKFVVSAGGVGSIGSKDQKKEGNTKIGPHTVLTQVTSSLPILETLPEWKAWSANQMGSLIRPIRNLYVHSGRLAVHMPLRQPHLGAIGSAGLHTHQSAVPIHHRSGPRPAQRRQMPKEQPPTH